jgi:hypothetical protein
MQNSLQAVKKSAVGQVTIFPLYVSLMFMYLGLLEGRGVEGSWQRLQQSLPKTLVTGKSQEVPCWISWTKVILIRRIEQQWTAHSDFDK